MQPVIAILGFRYEIDAGMVQALPHLVPFVATFVALYFKVDILWVFLGGTIVALLL